MTNPTLQAQPDADADALFAAFESYCAASGISPYPAQEEAVIELVSGSNVILATPTGSGKSLVALAAHFIALSRGQRSYYTAPIKALVSEKFFALVEVFGAENVGMVTGDSAVNQDAPIVCCTAEILANLALRHGAEAPVGQVVMDEFHYYADPERGWAWQVPLLLLERAQFLLMSATLGDITTIASDLERRTGASVAHITGVERPVPLTFKYGTDPIHDAISQLLDAGKAPIYIVHFSQAAALEQAQALAGAGIASRQQRDAIAAELGAFKFATGFGKTLSRLVRLGIGVHHAGMLPRYRRLVEQLAQRGLLRVICGTDTLGVGINVPIRTVLLTALTKFDGKRTRRLTAREFHQVAGRAGRAGFDTEGLVVAQAPEHEIENLKALAKAGADVKKQRKIVKKKAPDGFVAWSEDTYLKLQAASPEPLGSRMRMTAAMLINVIGRGGDVFANVRALVFDNHEPWKRQLGLARRALAIFRTLRDAGIVEVDAAGAITLTLALQENFALNQPLSPFALAVFELFDIDAPQAPLSGGPSNADRDLDGLDPADFDGLDPAASRGLTPNKRSEGGNGVGTGNYALDLVSVVEATLDDPRPVLYAQEHEARGEAIGAMKQEGIEYEQRMELLEEITYPKPLEQLLEQAYETFASSQPWVRDFELSPKSVVRDMYERAMTFTEYVSHYKLQRSEGVVLRYLSDAYRALLHTVPEASKTEDVRDLIEWLGALVRQVDSSLLDEWEQLVADDLAEPGAALTPHEAAPPRLSGNIRAFRVLVRNELFRRVLLAARDKPDALGELSGPDGIGADEWDAGLGAYFDEHDEILTGAPARSAELMRVSVESSAAGELWRVRQVFDDPQGDHDWGFDAIIDIAASDEAGEVVLAVTGVNRL